MLLGFWKMGGLKGNLERGARPRGAPLNRRGRRIHNPPDLEGTPNNLPRKGRAG